MKYMYIGKANAMSADLKQTAKRVRALLDTKELDGKRMFPGAAQDSRELKPSARHRHCHSKVRSYGSANRPSE